MIISPETEVYLIKSPLQVDEAQQLDFANATAQANYFLSLPKLALMNLTYQRENNRCFVSFNIEQIRSYNYVMYKNKQYGNKWFYAFITGMTYEGNTVTGIDIKTDVYQTYLFEFHLKESYVIRETVSDDTFGKHLIPESLDCGEYILDKTEQYTEQLVIHATSSQVTPSSKTPVIVVQCAERLGVAYEYDGQTEGEAINDMYVIGGLPQGCWYYMFYCVSEQVDILRQLKEWLDSIGKGDVILNMFMIPRQVVDLQLAIVHLYDKEGKVSQSVTNCYVASGNTYAPKNIFNKTIPKLNKYGSFTPRNAKTLTYPYQYLLVSNNTGGVLDFRYEDFNGNPQFACYGLISVNSSFGLTPLNSKKSDTPEIGISPEFLVGSTLPCLSWRSDFYLNWIAQNGNSIKQEGINTYSESMGRVASGTFTGLAQAGVAGMGLSAGAELAGAYVNVSDWIERTQEKIRQAKAVPDSVKGNLSAGDLAYSLQSIGYNFYRYCIREDMARKIDRYFDCYGYRVNEIKTPNTKSRLNWNYIQTLGVHIDGDIPQEAIAELKQIYDNGLTIWHNPANFLNYNVSNAIV